jgi:uncharacterized protein DUF2442
MRDVTEVVCLGGTRLLLTFDDGARREIDIATLTDFRGVFKPLKDQAYFRRVRVEPDIGTIVWPNGADFCPEVLYEKSTPAQAQESA